MDNYFHECPPMMSDGRLFTDYRSSQLREELFKQKYHVSTENDTRTFRINNGEKLMDNEWSHLRSTRSCFPQKKCFHIHPKTMVTSAYNNHELLAYNGDFPAPACNVDCHDFRMTVTRGSVNGRANCLPINAHNEYLATKCPKNK
jgi:hypothetical protein